MSTMIIKKTRIGFAAFFATLLFSAVGLLSIQPASAATIDNAVTSVTLNQEKYSVFEKVSFDFTWAVPDSAKSGDTFEITLPPELSPTSTARFNLLSPDGFVVATATWTGNTAVFVLSDYVDSHNDVHGDGFFSGTWDISAISKETVISFAIGSVVVNIPVEPGEEPVGPEPARNLFKNGYWTETSEGDDSPINALDWATYLPATEDGIAGPVTIVDTPNTSNTINCDSFYIAGVFANTPGAVAFTIGLDDSERVLSFDCSPTGFTLVLDQIKPGEYLGLFYKGDIVTPNLKSYTNSVTLSAPKLSEERQFVLNHTDAGGKGAGRLEEPVGPVDPVEPVDPVDPVAPVDPVDPEPVTPQGNTEKPTPVISKTSPSTAAGSLATTGSENVFPGLAAIMLILGGTVAASLSARRRNEIERQN